MGTNFKKSYKFAFVSSLYMSIILTTVLSILLYFFFELHVFIILLVGLICFAATFFVVQYRVEHFIYKRVKKIYDDLTLLESTSFSKGQITTDMRTLREEIDRYAKDKKLQIETLKVREEYRKEYIGNVSHELKTPLFTVQGYISTLLDGAADDPKLREKYLKRADKGVERLIYIIKDLDMITKLETGDLSLDIEKFNMVKGDKERLEQVVSNLIVNSIKYGDINGTTEVSIERLIKNKVIIRITDNGEGIEREHIPRLFERFYRVDKSGSRQEGGSGLGLAIVKHIIEAHDEKVYIESEYGVGSEFSC